MPAPINLLGQRFGRLTVTEQAPSVVCGSKPFTRWVCQCDCGVVVTTYTNGLRNGHTKSCGCMKRDLAAQRSTKHAGTNSRLYAKWKAMKSRCENPNNVSFRNYGGRGIRVCDRWQDFDVFRRDVGEPPSHSHTLDRVDNDKNYEPDNCRWADKHTQDNNKRTSVRITFDGQTLTLTEWGRRLGVSANTIKRRWHKRRTVYAHQTQQGEPK
jgi:hypothetical protein